jgi:hypothetical protein
VLRTARGSTKGTRQLIINAYHMARPADQRWGGAGGAPGLTSPRRSAQQVVAEKSQQRRLSRHRRELAEPDMRHHPVIITVTSARQKEDDLWPPMIVYPIPVVGLVSRAAGRPR